VTVAGGHLYGFPVLGRTGLAHSMLSWARCTVWCHESGARMIAPVWFAPRIGPYLRRELDKRAYHKLFRPAGDISGLKRAWLLAAARREDIHEGRPPIGLAAGARPLVVRFFNAFADNEKKSFDQVVGHEALLRDRLEAITRPRFRPPPQAAPFIAIHVRTGDFAPADDAVILKGRTNVRLPVDWYADRLRALRAAIGEPVPAVLFSDGRDEELRPILAEPGVRRVRGRQSITDLLDIGRGIAVISSGSGFSLWGAFLGSAPRLCHPAQMIVRAYREPAMEVESAFGETLPEPFVDRARARLAGGVC
jgi:hypothetical protein